MESKADEFTGGGRTAGDVNVYRDDAIAASDDRVAVVVVSTTISAAAHGNDPSRLRHLIVSI